VVQHGAGDEVIKPPARLAGHALSLLSRPMEAKRRALDEIAARQRAADKKTGRKSRSSRLWLFPNQYWFNKGRQIHWAAT